MFRFFLAVILIGAIVGKTSADVTLTFDSTTQGFVNSFGNGSVAWSAEHGGSLALNFTSAGWTNPVGFLSLTSTPELAAEFALALANGGNLSFDYMVRQEDIIGYDPEQLTRLV